jgi:hypothetical protein
MEALLANEFVVLAVDALLHLASIFVLGFVVILASKFLSKGFVDAKIPTGLVIATLLVFMRVFLLNNIHRVFGDFEVIVSMAAIAFVLFLTSLVLVDKLMSLPLLGTILSSLVIVAAQLALAHYTPILSLKLMPEGQRFAEYAGVSNARTRQLMAQAEKFQSDRGSHIGGLLKEAIASIASLTSEEEQKTLSKDMASGVRFVQERRAYTESLSAGELAEYRASMRGFMEEQGVDLQNRYSLENLKNASPEDLENLANFMKDMNQVYGFTEELSQGAEGGERVPPTIDSLRKIAENLRSVDIGEENSRQFASLLKDMIGSEEVGAEMAKVRGQIAEMKGNSSTLMGALRKTNLKGMQEGLEPPFSGSDQGVDLGPDSGLLSDLSGSSLLGRGEKLNRSGPSAPSTASRSRIDYYIPVNTFSDFPKPQRANKPRAVPKGAPKDVHTAPSADYFSDSELSPSLTDDYVLQAPISPPERGPWINVANTIRIGAWFEGTGDNNPGTIFVDGNAYRSGETIERTHQDEQFLFRFEGVQEGQVILRSLKRERRDGPELNSADASPIFTEGETP